MVDGRGRLKLVGMMGARGKWPLYCAYVSKPAISNCGGRLQSSSVIRRRQKDVRPRLMLTLSKEAGIGETVPPPAAIIITVPSSPDEPPKECQRVLRTPPLKALKLCAPSDMIPRAPFGRETLSPQPSSHDTAMSPYQERLAAADLPPPGPEHFAARRALWLVPGPNPSLQTEANSARRRLEKLLATPQALEDDVVWQAGVDRVWRGLINGARLRNRLPLALVVRPTILGTLLLRPHLSSLQLKILQAGWIREGTWPKGAIVPDSDDIPDAPLPETSESRASTTPYVSTPGPMEDRYASEAAFPSNRHEVH